MRKFLTGKSTESSTSSPNARRKSSAEPSSTRRRSESLVSSGSSRHPDRKRSERDHDRDRTISSQYPSSSRDDERGDYFERSTTGPYIMATNSRHDERVPSQEITRYNTYPLMSNNPRPEEEDGWVDEEDAMSNATRHSKHRKRSSSHERKHERRRRSSSRERDEKKGKNRKSSSSVKSDAGADDSRHERRRGETTIQRDSDIDGKGKNVARVNSSGQKEIIRVRGDTPGHGTSRDPHSRSSGIDGNLTSQFPGQIPETFAAPYRPEFNAAGGFGLAADFYGDQGESVHRQPGVRAGTPVIAGTQPHLQAASAAPNPPQETGHGAAQDYYMSGGLGGSPAQGIIATSSNGQSVKPSRPSNPSQTDIGSSKPGKVGKPLSQAVGGAAAGAAVGYAISNTATHAQSNGGYGVGAQMPYQTSATFAAGGQHSQYDHSTSAPAIPTLGSSYAASPAAKPSTKPAGAGLAAAAAYQHHHDHSHHDQYHSNSIEGSAYHSPGVHGQSFSPYAQGGMRMQHQHKGPVSKFVDWWKDHEDVRKMEEYTEYIGVCRYCFDPHTAPGDAPREHHYRRRRSSDSLRGSRESLARRSTESLSRTGRVSKSSRYERYDYSSDEGRRRRDKSGNWVAAGLGAYGLGKLFSSGRDFDDTYSVRSGRYNDSRTSIHGGREHSASHGKFGRSEYGIVGSEHSHHPKQHIAHRPGHGHTEKQFIRHHSRSRSRTRSRSRDRKSALLGAGIGDAAGASLVGSSHRHRSRSPRKEIRVEKRRSRDTSPLPSTFGGISRRTSNPERQFARHHEHKRENSPGVFGGFFGRSSPSPKRRGSKTHRSKKKKGFFTFSNSSSSSAGSDLVYGSKLDLTVDHGTHRRRSSPKRRYSTKERK
ncbi:MAG: hypothetical protein M1820_010901, partial [Bogoriella megaspora]